MAEMYVILLTLGSCGHKVRSLIYPLMSSNVFHVLHLWFELFYYVNFLKFLNFSRFSIRLEKNRIKMILF